MNRHDDTEDRLLHALRDAQYALAEWWLHVGASNTPCCDLDKQAQARRYYHEVISRLDTAIKGVPR